MSQRIRGQEATVQIIVDGDLKSGTFTKVLSFNLTPRQDVQEASFIGELEDDLDFQHHGYDFDYDVQHMDDKMMAFLALIVEREQLHLPHPNVNMVVTMAYRTPDQASYTFVMEQCFVKVDSLGFGGRKEYVTSKVSGKCKVISQLT